MKCKYCNVGLSEKEAARKDEATEKHMDLCDECYEASWEASHDFAGPSVWQDEGIQVEEDTRTDSQYWKDFVELHFLGLSESWCDGLGLIHPQERWFLLYHKAVKSYYSELERGTPRPLAAEIAIKAPWVLDRV